MRQERLVREKFREVVEGYKLIGPKSPSGKYPHAVPE